MAEIEKMRSDYDIEKVIFTDDLFTMRKEWLFPFCQEYTRRIGLPFYCIVRADYVDEEIVAAAKESIARDKDDPSISTIPSNS